MQPIHQSSSPQPLLSIILFITFIIIGLWLSLHKPLWNDEIYTQTSTIDSKSFVDILTGNLKEGNLSPLFYFVQKLNSQIFGYSFPEHWDGQWYFGDMRSQLIIRIPSIIYMSAALTLLFLYFSKYYSPLFGLLSLLIALSTLTVWEYWADARPYPLWYLLSLAQSLVIAHMYKTEKNHGHLMRTLAIINLLLSLTAVVSLIQIAISSLLLWIHHQRKMKHYVYVLLIPSLICIFYFLKSPIVGYKAIEFSEIVWANFPLEYIVLCTGAFLIFIFQEISQRKSLRDLTGNIHIGLFFLQLLQIISALLMLIYIKSKETTFGPVPTRTFLFLAPAGVVLSSFFSLYLLTFKKDNPWIRLNIFIFIGGIISLSALNSLQQLLLSDSF